MTQLLVTRLKSQDRNEANPDQAVLPASIKGHLLEMLDDFDLDYRCAAVRGLRAFLDGETVDGLMSHAGQHDTLDMEMFKTLAAYPDVFHRIVENVESGSVAVQHAAGFVLGFLAQQIIPEDDVAEVARFLAGCFNELDAETKVAAVGLCQNLEHPALHAVIRAGLADPDTEVSAFAADAAYMLGLDTSQAA